MSYDQETRVMWEKYLHDPRPFIQICEEHGMDTIEGAYRRFSAAGLDWRGAKRSKACPICGKTFTVAHGGQCYCGKECAKEAKARRLKARYQTTAPQPKSSPRTVPTISEILCAAEKAGMSYGAYVSAMKKY